MLPAVATDRAGNTTEATRQVKLAADDVIVGQVLSDVTGHPLRDVTVTYTGAVSSPAPSSPTSAASTRLRRATRQRG